ncbi:hypothetical protein J4E93_010714 [Alternaria ventricosa]|uniref:uncharacterized protein n=1 Tax=Alternaria ventricosa TaxID=1187951 RepID=UPI0020C2194D|nr:uncharacterized protein J4E93_010714 [Alternaria ventricosa]KAI4637048.1 hypothetical protein J4E93_010714 [Alternaria ventricosa]
MLQLNTDCQRRVLNYINTRSDLRSLCLVSKELNQLALEKLYKRIDIRLFSENNTNYILELLKDVKENLRYTRELVVEDECIAEETTSVQYGNVGLPDLKCWTGTGATSADPEVRDSNLEQVLDLIPANALRTFRFLARRPLPWWLHKKLASKQRNITNLQVSLNVDSDDINEPKEVLLQRDNNLKRLDVHIADGPLNTILLDYFHSIGENLQSLSLSAQHSSNVSKMIWDNVWHPTQPKLPLKELRLTRLRLREMYKSLSTIIDFSKLLKLDLVGCTGAFVLLSHMTKAMPNQKFDLTHVALNDFLSAGAIIEPEDAALTKFLKACPNLRSLHVGLSNLDPLPPGLKQYLQSRGKELTSLSLYSKTEIIDAEEFDLVCRSCPNLEQFAAGIDEEFIMADGMWYHNLRDFVNSLRHLPKLRTLHTHRSSISLVGGLGNGYGNRWNTSMISLQVQKFANLVFGELYTVNPDFCLETLIVGHLGPLLRKSNAVELANGREVNSQHYLPQFCFVRSRQEDLLGRTATTGVMVSRAVLKRTHDYMGILDVDAGVEAWEQWVGQAI